MLPNDVLIDDFLTAWATWSNVTLYRLIAFSDSSIDISSFLLPWTSTISTWSKSDSSSLIFSAALISFFSEVFPWTASVTRGILKDSSETVGGKTPSGIDSIESTFRFISWISLSIPEPEVASTRIEPKFSLAVDVIFFISSRSFRDSSTLTRIWSSISLGDAPGHPYFIETTGAVIIGKTSFSTLKKFKIPIIIILNIKRLAALEFLTHHEIIFNI